VCLCISDETTGQRVNSSATLLDYSTELVHLMKDTPEASHVDTVSRLSLSPFGDAQDKLRRRIASPQRADKTRRFVSPDCVKICHFEAKPRNLSFYVVENARSLTVRDDKLAAT
jgi:hypothetical protein